MASAESSESRPRAREVGLVSATLPCGRVNAISDVEGVRVGQVSIVTGAGPLRVGHGPVRTGVTVILPHAGDLYQQKVRAAVHTINGYGKVLGFEQVRELGAIESPIALTNTFNVGLVADALIQLAVERDGSIGVEPESGSLNVVVGETNDGYLNDIGGRHVRYEHVRAAFENALAAPNGQPIAEGSVGAGTGTQCYGWKGGIGTSSRLVEKRGSTFTLGVLVQTNFGLAEQLTVLGVPVGRSLFPSDVLPEKPQAASPREANEGSVMIVIATDAPLSERQLRRIAVRSSVGLTRSGTVLGHGSGDFVIAFSTTKLVEHRAAALVRESPEVSDEGLLMPTMFTAIAEAVEEAVLNSLCRAQTVVGRDGHVRHALPVDRVRTLLAERT